jgi:hypothetical protein
MPKEVPSTANCITQVPHIFLLLPSHQGIARVVLTITGNGKVYFICMAVFLWKCSIQPYERRFWVYRYYWHSQGIVWNCSITQTIQSVAH